MDKKRAAVYLVLFLAGLEALFFSPLFRSAPQAERPAIPPPRYPPSASFAPGQPQPLEAQSADSVSVTPLPGATLEAVPTAVEVLGTVDFANPPEIGPGDAETLNQVAGLAAGREAAWLLTPGGVKVFDKASRRWGLLTALTADNVRSREIHLDEDPAAAWFAGDALYRYDVAGRKLEVFRPGAGAFKVIKKVFPAPAVLWLATDRGVYAFDKGARVLKKLTHPAYSLDKTFIDGSMDADGGWLVTDGFELVRLSSGPDGVALDAVGKLPHALPLDVLSFDGDAWMVVPSAGAGAAKLARLAVLDAERKTLSFYEPESDRSLVGLRRWNDRILAAGAYYIHAIDPDTMTSALLDGQGGSIFCAGPQVLFTGTSYDYSVGTGLVVKYVLDPSRGWTPAETRDLSFQGHQVLDVRNADDDLWALFSDAVVRYDKAAGTMTSYRTAAAAERARYAEEESPWP